MRERLVELIGNFPTYGGTLKEKWCGEAVERLADHLLANGVIVPPCKVEDITYIFDYEVNNYLETKIRGIIPSIVEAITIVDDGLWVENEHAKYQMSAIGDLIFLTKEEAEEALERMKGGE